MRPDFFWNSWTSSFKRIYQGLLFIFVCSILAYIITYSYGSSFIINWDVETLIDPIKTNFETYRLGFFEFPININNYVVSKSFIASDLQVNSWPAYILLIWLGVFISIMLALITDLSRFWFVASVLLLTVLFVGLKLDYLVLFNSYNKIGLLVAILLYFPALYYFHFVRADISFVFKLSTYLICTAVFGIIIFYFSHVRLPFLHLANYGIFVPLILTAIFAFMVGHEIVSALLRVITSGMLAGQSRSLAHFAVLSVVFIINGVLVLLRNSGRIDLEIYLIGSFWLLPIAAIIGLWGYKFKEQTYEGMFPFYPIGAFLYLGLAITAHLTISYIFISGNDSLMEVMEDIIIYSQIGYSVMFVIYVIANFIDLISHNVDVGKVLYKPRRMPYFISRFAAVIVVMALFFKFNMAPYYQSFAGYYAGVGDLYLATDDYLSAAEYYNLSNIFSGTSHRANYALATLERRKGNSTEEINYLKKAIGKHPTPFAYVNLASKYLEGKGYFEAIFTLKDGLEQYPENSYILNNLGLAYLAMGNVDTAYANLDLAQFARTTSNEASANIFAMLSKEKLSIKEDTLAYLLEHSEDLTSINNLVVLANNLKQESHDKAIVKFGNPDTEHIEQIVYNYNKTINSPALVDSLYLEQMKTFYDSSRTSWFQDNLYFASALSLYRQGEVSSALKRLNLLAVQNPEKEYFSFLGKISLANGADALAIDYLKNAFQNGDVSIAPELAFAYMEYGDLERARFIWRQIEFGGDSLDAVLASKMIAVIEADDIDDILNTDLQSRFSLLAYRYSAFEQDDLSGLILSFRNEDVQAMGFLRLFNIYIELDAYDKALEILQHLGQLNISRQKLIDDINIAQCAYAFHTNDVEMMRRLSTSLESTHLMVQDYLRLFSCLDKLNSKRAIELSVDFQQIGLRNPFFENGVLTSVAFFNDELEDPDKAYDILLNAVNLNPFSIELNKAYAKQSLKVGLKNYALETMEELRTMMPAAVFRTFEVEFLKLMNEIESKSADW